MQRDAEPACAILTDALNRCRREDGRSRAVLKALSELAAKSRVQWPFEQFRRAPDIERDEDRWQTANAALNGIRLNLPR